VGALETDTLGGDGEADGSGVVVAVTTAVDDVMSASTTSVGAGSRQSTSREHAETSSAAPNATKRGDIGALS
jgi:hypothetical protein